MSGGLSNNDYGHIGNRPLIKIVTNSSVISRVYILTVVEIYENTNRHNSKHTMRILISIVLCVMGISALAQKPITIGLYKKDVAEPYLVTGKVTSVVSGELLIGANVFIKRQQIGTSTNADGEYSLRLYQGTYIIEISTIGYETQSKRVNVQGPGKINFNLEENVTELDELVIQSEGADQNVTSKDIGKNVLTVESIKSLPPLAGEVDILKSLTLLPGVSTQGEASSGFSVRGGGFDQNLILLGGATLYNPSHLFGFFTGFNSSIVRDVSLYKGAIPSNYGGRGSSVVDVTYKKGNFGQWEGDVSLGIATSKFSAGGPIIRDKLSIMTAARGSYPNWLIRQTKDPNIANSTASFFDSNFIVNYILNDRNDIEYSFYISGDEFQFANNIANEWQNLSQVIRWNSTLAPGWVLQVSGIQNKYSSNLIDDTPFNSFDIESNIDHNELNVGLNVELNERQSFKVGVQTKFLKNNLGTLTPGEDSAIAPENIEDENGIESGIYFQHNVDFTPKIGISYGLRYSDFRNRGPGTVNTYDPNETRSERSVISSEEFGEVDIQTYNGFEPRFSVNYQLGQTTSIKGGYSRIYQYIHLVTNTTTISPTDTWKLSDSFIEPQIVSQYSLGFFKNFRNNRFETSIEGYYKDLDNLVEYKDGADLFINPNLETELISGVGRTYGVELYLKKIKGRLNGWVSYTYSRTLRKVAGEFAEDIINDGDFYPSNFDSPNNLTTVANYKLGANTTLSGIFTLSSGRPFTLPKGKFEYDRIDLGFYDERNNERGPMHHRLDVSLRFRFPSKRKVWDGHWTLAVYNFYGRKNPFSVFFQDIEGAPPQAYKLAVVGTPFPSISYEMKF